MCQMHSPEVTKVREAMRFLSTFVDCANLTQTELHLLSPTVFRAL